MYFLFISTPLFWVLMLMAREVAISQGNDYGGFVACSSYIASPMFIVTSLICKVNNGMSWCLWLGLRHHNMHSESLLLHAHEEQQMAEMPTKNFLASNWTCNQVPWICNPVFLLSRTKCRRIH